MARAAAQVLVAAVLMAQVKEVVVLILASMVIKIIKAIKAVTINNPARGDSGNSNLDIKVIQSS